MWMMLRASSISISFGVHTSVWDTLRRSYSGKNDYLQLFGNCVTCLLVFISGSAATAMGNVDPELKEVYIMAKSHNDIAGWQD
jgi:hypothetical protein